MDWPAILLSVKLSSIVCGSLFLIGTPIAYWVPYSVVALPIVLPPTVIGFYILVAIGSRSPIGRAWASWTGHGLAFTFEGLVLASLLYSLPFAAQPTSVAFSQVDPQLIEASSVLGASGLRTFLRIILPLSINGVITGAVLSFAHTMGEFGVVLMVGGDIPGVTRTVSITIYDRVQRLDYAAANRTALVLLLFSFAVLSIVYALNRNSLAASPLSQQARE